MAAKNDRECRYGISFACAKRFPRWTVSRNEFDLTRTAQLARSLALYGLGELSRIKSDKTTVVAVMVATMAVAHVYVLLNLNSRPLRAIGVERTTR